MALVHKLKEKSCDLAVRLLELVEEEHRVRPPPHRLGELAALVVADVAGRRADEPRDRVALRELGHVEAGERGVGVEEELGQRLRELRLADAGGPDEEEDAERPLGQPRARDAHRVGTTRRAGLPDDPLRELRLEVHRLSPGSRLVDGIPVAFDTTPRCARRHLLVGIMPPPPHPPTWPPTASLALEARQTACVSSPARPNAVALVAGPRAPAQRCARLPLLSASARAHAPWPRPPPPAWSY